MKLLVRTCKAITLTNGEALSFLKVDQNAYWLGSISIVFTPSGDRVYVHAFQQIWWWNLFFSVVCNHKQSNFPNIRESSQSEKSGSGDIYFLDANFGQFLRCDMWRSIFSLNVLGRWQKVKPKGAQGRIRGLLGLRQTLTNVRDFDLEKMIAYERWSDMVASHACLL